jgi:membrane protease YdiL (CAAX protease family)
MTATVKHHRLLAFSVFAYALSWWAVPLGVFVPAGPLLAAIIVTGLTDGRSALRALARGILRWRTRGRWYAIAISLPRAAVIVSVALNIALGAPSSALSNLDPWYLLLLVFATRLLNPLDGPVGEEPGWRGFALPQLQRERSPLGASLILAPLVVGWHLPLLFSPGRESAVDLPARNRGRHLRLHLALQPHRSQPADARPRARGGGNDHARCARIRRSRRLADVAPLHGSVDRGRDCPARVRLGVLARPKLSITPHVADRDQTTGACFTRRRNRPGVAMNTTPANPAETERVRHLQDRAARHYDRQIGLVDRLLFADGRRWACQRARGDVLQIAIGTARNLSHYPAEITLTGIELSKEMLAIGQRRAHELRPEADLRLGDAQALEFPNETFDTVVCTLGLCTIPDPHLAIAEARTRRTDPPARARAQPNPPHTPRPAAPRTDQHPRRSRPPDTRAARLPRKGQLPHQAHRVIKAGPDRPHRCRQALRRSI